MIKNILELSQGDFNRLPDVEKLFPIKECFLDVLDGNSRWHNIRYMTGINDERCKEISLVYELLLNSKGRMI